MPKNQNPTPQQEQQRERQRAYRREYDRRNPDKAVEWRLKSYARYLTRHAGKLVIPIPPALPWTEEQKGCILHAIEVAMQDQLPEGGMDQ